MDDELRDMLAQIAGGAGTGLLGLNKIIKQLVSLIVDLATENSGLRDRVWALDRATHNHDPLEGEDG